MRYGFYLPTRGPTATRDGILALAREGERLGLHSAMIADHNHNDKKGRAWRRSSDGESAVPERYQLVLASPSPSISDGGRPPTGARARWGRAAAAPALLQTASCGA
jgi:hypothetical protein